MDPAISSLIDRAGLDVLDWAGLTLELTRQVAAQLRHHVVELSRARDAYVSESSIEGTSKSDRRPEVLWAVGVRCVGDL